MRECEHASFVDGAIIGLGCLVKPDGCVYYNVSGECLKIMRIILPR